MCQNGCCSEEDCRSVFLLDGQPGQPGANGLNGTFGSNSDKYLFNTATVGNPTNTKLLVDNAAFSAVTSISVSNIDFAGVNVGVWLGVLGTSTAAVKGFIQVNKEFDNTAFARYKVTAVTANAGYYTFTVSSWVGSSNSPFASGDSVIFSYVISGDNGAAGTAGVNILYNNCITVDSGNTAGINVSLKTYNIPANSFVNTGDCVTILATNECTDDQLPSAPNSDIETLEVVNNAVAQAFQPSGVYSNNFQFREFKVELNRTSSTTLRATTHVLDSNNVTVVTFADMTGLDFTLVTSVTMFGNTTIASPSATGYVKSLRLYVDLKLI